LKFLSVNKAKDLSALKGSGIIGLSPRPAKWEELKDSMKNGVPGFIA
jgi:hypothetical protein